MGKKIKPLVYPFTYEEWLAHPSTKPKLKWCKKIGNEITLLARYGTQQKLNL